MVAAAREIQQERPAKADVIVAAATRIFLDAGYGNASMDAIAVEAGVAKQTLYSHFGSKAQLFEAIVHDLCTQLLGLTDEDLENAAEADSAPEPVLNGAGRRFLTVILHPDSIAHYRAVVAESVRFPELAEVFYRAGPRRAVAGLAETLRAFDAAGELRIDDAEAGANMFYAMLKGDLHMRCVLGLQENPSPAEIDKWVAHVVSAFLVIHRPRSES